MNCTEGDPYVSSTPFKVVVLVQAILSGIAFIINPLIFRTLYFHTCFHRNIRILLGLCAIVNIIHSGAFTIIQCSPIEHRYANGFVVVIRICISDKSNGPNLTSGTHSFLMFTASSGCDVMVSGAFCNIFRVPAYVALLCYISLNNTMVFERFVATVRVKNYEDRAVLFGRILAVFSVVSAIFVAFFSAGWPVVHGKVPYCAVMNPDNMTGMGYAALVGAISQIVIGILFVSVYATNKWMDSRPLFNVKTQYQIRENLTVCRMLTPWLSFHFVAMFFLMAANYFIINILQWNIFEMRARTVVVAVNLMPFFCVISPVVLKVIYEREGKRRRRGIKELSKPVSPEQAYLMYTSLWDKPPS